MTRLLQNCLPFARSFRATVHGGAGSSLSKVFNQIKEVQKKFKARELEKKELEVMVAVFVGIIWNHAVLLMFPG